MDLVKFNYDITQENTNVRPQLYLLRWKGVTDEVSWQLKGAQTRVSERLVTCKQFEKRWISWTKILYRGFLVTFGTAFQRNSLYSVWRHKRFSWCGNDYVWNIQVSLVTMGNLIAVVTWQISSWRVPSKPHNHGESSVITSSSNHTSHRQNSG